MSPTNLRTPTVRSNATYYTSRLPGLVELLLSRRLMLAQLDGALPRELTGRTHYNSRFAPVI
jgi:hypothetical protein